MVTYLTYEHASIITTSNICFLLSYKTDHESFSRDSTNHFIIIN
jgi:hypothetical protein